jgi:NTE family protein
MKKVDYSSHSKRNIKSRRQRALVLQGGGSLGPYEAGVIEVLCKRLSEEDKEKNREKESLFDIVAGTSIGAMNAAILVSNVVNKHKTWEKAAEILQKFWTDRLAVRNMNTSKISKPWYDKYKEGVTTAASEEAARQYYSVKSLLLDQVKNKMYSVCKPQNDTKFFDDTPLNGQPNYLNNDWYLHSTLPLRKSIKKYAKFPIATEFSNTHGQKQRQQPRLLIFSVDVAEGVTVTFDSYPKADESRKSVYGKFNEIVIDYNKGIDIEHVMASGTVPEFYKYAKVPIHAKYKKADEDSSSNPKKTNGNNSNDIRYFFDGGWLSNTPFRELLTAHQDYWKNKPNGGEIPDLDVYIVNVHPSKFSGDKLRQDHDGVKERKDDIIYSDRTSYYDEKMAHLITAYTNLCNKLNKLVATAIREVKVKKNRDELHKELKTALAAKIDNRDGMIHPTTNKDLLNNAFNLSVVMRIERASYVNNTSYKTGDLTFETISKLIIEGRCDAWFTIIEKSINDDAKLDNDNKLALINALHMARQNLIEKDYEDNDSQTYQLLTEFIKKVEAEKGREKDRLKNIIKSAEELLSILDNYKNLRAFNMGAMAT